MSRTLYEQDFGLWADLIAAGRFGELDLEIWYHKIFIQTLK
jgi:hypothetical protein